MSDPSNRACAGAPNRISRALIQTLTNDLGAAATALAAAGYRTRVRVPRGRGREAAGAAPRALAGLKHTSSYTVWESMAKVSPVRHNKRSHQPSAHVWCRVGYGGSVAELWAGIARLGLTFCRSARDGLVHRGASASFLSSRASAHMRPATQSSSTGVCRGLGHQRGGIRARHTHLERLWITPWHRREAMQKHIRSCCSSPY